MESKERAQILSDADDALLLLRSPEWKQYIAFLKRRAEKLQIRVNQAVEAGNLVEAQIALALLKDNMRQAELFVKETVETKKKLKKEQSDE